MAFAYNMIKKLKPTLDFASETYYNSSMKKRKWLEELYSDAEGIFILLGILGVLAIAIVEIVKNV
jgi:hypothetical protein